MIATRFRQSKQRSRFSGSRLGEAQFITGSKQITPVPVLAVFVCLILVDEGSMRYAIIGGWVGIERRPIGRVSTASALTGC